MTKRITMHGAGDDDVAKLRELLARSAGSLDSAWNIYSGNDTDLLVIDVDTVYGHMDWLRAHSSGRPVAVLTEHTQFSDADLVLHKPLDADNLVDVLNRAGASIAERAEAVEAPPPPAPAAPAPARAAPAPAAPALVAFAPAPVRVRVHAPAPAPAVAPPPPAPPPAPEVPRERRLADWLADGALTVPTSLQAEGSPELVIDPGARQFYADGNLRALACYCTRTIAPAEWREVGAAQIAQVRDSGKMQPVARMIWLAHALGSNGQIAPGLDANAKFKLARWPQIEREFPKHFRIATVMLKQLATLAEIAEQSGATLADVIDFTNAYNATGYIETDAAARAAEPSQRDSGRHAILSRLRNPFGGG